jgi:hypothetical protein
MLSDVEQESEAWKGLLQWRSDDEQCLAQRKKPMSRVVDERHDLRRTRYPLFMRRCEYCLLPRGSGRDYVAAREHFFRHFIYCRCRAVQLLYSLP